MVVYVDILIVINAAVNYAVLLTADKLLKRGIRLLRLLAGASLGAIFSLIVFLRIDNVILLLLIRVATTALLTLAAFGFKSRSEYLKAALMTIAVSMLYSGGFILFYQLFKPPDMLIINDVPYFNVDPLSLILLTSVIYLILLILIKLFSERIKSTVVPLRFTVSDKEYSCIGKLDTGSDLTEPFSGSPVIIVDKEVFSPANDTPCRIIPYTTVNGSSYLKAVKADTVSVEHKPITKQVYIASGDIHNGSYQAVINLDIIR